MDWQMQILLFLICLSGLSELCCCNAYSNLENAQRFEVCVVGELSQSTLFSEREKSQLRKTLKETDVRMRKIGVDPTRDSNARTMLRLFSASLAHLVFEDENPTKRYDRKQSYISALKLCSSSLAESIGEKLMSEVSRIFTSMENQKNFNNEAVLIPENKPNVLDKMTAYEDSKARKREKRAPQLNEGFEFNPPLEPVIAGTLITSPAFGRTFKDGLFKQDATNYARSMVEEALKDYDYAVIQEAINEVTNALSSFMFMPQTVDFAFAISKAINKVLSGRGMDTFADGVSIGNALISKLQAMTGTQNPMFSFPPSFISPASSSEWQSDTSIASQLKVEAPPLQIKPSWDLPAAPQFQFDSNKQDFGPQMFSDSGSSYNLNPSFAPDPVAPLPGFGTDLYPVEDPGMSSFPGNIPFGQVIPSVVSQSSLPPSPFPVDQTFGQKSMFPNQPTTTDEAIPFQFDLPVTQVSSTSFIDPFPAQQPDILNLPPIPKENTNPFDQTFIQSAISEQSPIPKMEETFVKEDSSYPSDIKVPNQSQTTSYQPDEDTSKSGTTPDLYIMDVTSVIESNLDLSDEFASVFSREISPSDAASFATAMTKFSLSQYDPTVAANVESQVGDAVYNLPLNSSPAEYARAIADVFIKAINQNGLLNSINSKIIADSLIAGLKRELSNRSTTPDSSTVIQNDKPQTKNPDETPIPLNSGATPTFSDISMTLGSDGSAQDTNQKTPSKEPKTNTEVSSSNSSVQVPNIFPKEMTDSGSKNLKPNPSFEIPLEPGPFVSGTQSEQPTNEAPNLSTTTTSTSSPLEVTESSTSTTKLSTITDLLYSTFVTTETVPTSDPYITTLAKAIKNPKELFKLMMDEVDSSLKALNQTSGLKPQQNIATIDMETSTSLTQTTKMDEFVPVTPPNLSNSKSMEVDSVRNGQSSIAPKVEQPTPLPLQKTSTTTEDSEIVTEKATELDEESVLFAERVTSIATSAIAYIRSGNLNLDELCGKINVLAFVVEIPPVDNCTEIAMMDYLLNVLNAVVANLRRS